MTFVLYSDDQGKTWSKSDDVDIRDLAPKNKTGADEPAVVELKDGRVMMIIRTSLGFIAKSYSSDGGLTWSKPRPIKGPVSPDSPASIKRIPRTGDLLLVWNNNKTARRPLNSAVSKDEGETWENIRCVDAAGASPDHPAGNNGAPVLARADCGEPTPPQSPTYRCPARR